MFQIWNVLHGRREREEGFVVLKKNPKFKIFPRFYVLEAPLLLWNPFSLFAIIIPENRQYIISYEQRRGLPKARRFNGVLSMQGSTFKLTCLLLPPNCKIELQLQKEQPLGQVQFYLEIWNSGLQARILPHEWAGFVFMLFYVVCTPTFSQREHFHWIPSGFPRILN